MHVHSLWFLLAAGACVDSTPDLRESASEINGPSAPATAAMVSHAAAILHGSTPGSSTAICSGTRISSRHILTARHCDVKEDGTYFIGLYTDNDGYSSVHEILDVVHPAGTTADEWTDSSGDYADFSIVEIRATRGANPATLAWTYPGANVNGYKVGNGRHDDEPNPSGELRYVASPTDSPDDNDGSFITTYWRTDSADSGGPFYVGGKVLGTNTGGDWDLDSAVFRGLYTSVPEHLKFILQTIDYTWGGIDPQTDHVANGQVMATFYQSRLACQYACEKTSSCIAYNHHTTLQLCRLYSTMTSISPSTGWTMGWILH